MKYLVILLLILGLLAGCNQPPDPPPVPVKCRVLLVGAGDYNGCSADLSAPPYAVDSMKELLDRYYNFEVLTILKDRKATKTAITNNLYHTFKGAEKDDISIFYFAGHGGVKNNIFYICPTDTNWSVIENITVAEIEYWLDKIKGTKIVILDCCHSGGFIGKTVYRLLNRLGYQVLTSCMGEQVCYQMGGTFLVDPYMVFTRGMLEGCKENYLADTDHNNVITMTEIYNFALEWVADNLNRPQDAQIHPEGSIFPFIEY